MQNPSDYKDHQHKDYNHHPVSKIYFDIQETWLKTEAEVSRVIKFAKEAYEKYAPLIQALDDEKVPS